MASFQPLLIGILLVITAASEPSARNQAAPSFIPTSLKSVDSITPVHSLWLVKPQISWAVIFSLPVRKLPEHSINAILDTEGNLFKSDKVNRIGFLTIP
jgi:hypothetical protein